MKTQALKLALDTHGFDAAIGGEETPSAAQWPGRTPAGELPRPLQ
jgi:hypothetical protein